MFYRNRQKRGFHFSSVRVILVTARVWFGELFKTYNVNMGALAPAAGSRPPVFGRKKGARNGGEGTHLRVCRFINVSCPGPTL